MLNDEDYMERCLALAERGLGYVAPNPLVGSVIVDQGEVIGEGYHQFFGGAHAELNAISSVKEQKRLKQATMYVNLEPCCHFGKTPPCAELIIKNRIPRVVVGTVDINPRMAGKGIERLKKAGIEVTVGVKETDCNFLNRRFNCYFKNERPYVVLKWAQTSDAFIAKSDFSSKWISNEDSRTLAHKWRSEEASVLIGRNTAHYDNPRLTVRRTDGANPIRIVIDRQLKLSQDLKLFKEGAQTIVFNEKISKEAGHVSYLGIEFDDDLLFTLMKALIEREIQSVLVEGGAVLLSSFIKSGLWDEARVFTAQKSFGDGISAPRIAKRPDIMEDISGDKLEIFYNL